MTPLRVMVGVPTHEHMPAVFAYDLAQMMAFLGAAVEADDTPLDSVNLTFVTGTYIHVARQDLAEEALKQDADYVLWLDSDMRFPRDTLVRLLSHQEDIVGINYSQRGIPPDFVAIRSVQDGEKCITTPGSTGLEEVEAVGFGVVLMRTDVLRALPDPTGQHGPWFAHEWRPDLQDTMGEDVYFCERAREAGYKVYVDHDLSKECRHVGQLEYRIEHALDTHTVEV